MFEDGILARKLGERDNVERREKRGDPNWQGRVRDQTLGVAGIINQSQVIADAEISKLQVNQSIQATAHQRKNEHQSTGCSLPSRYRNRFGGQRWCHLAMKGAEPSGTLECRRPRSFLERLVLL